MTETIRQGIVESLLAAATTTGDGTVYALPYSKGGLKISWQIGTTGSPSGISSTIQISLDKTVWATIDTSTATAGEVRVIAALVVAKFIKVNLGTLTSGTAPTVTITMLAC